MGEVFAGRFELIDPIAEGGMGSVWVVKDRRDDQLYAGKLLRQSDSASLLRFMREQSMRIHHPRIVTPLSWAGEDDRVLFTMPLVSGGSVATWLLNHGALTPAWTVAFLDETLEALEAVHALGIVHRDVKPGNLLLQPDESGRPHVMLTDFGISAHVDEPRLTRASQVIGSPGYLSPEQLAGADPALPQDLYALGVVGLEMLHGMRPPAVLDHARELQRRRPDALRALLLSATEADPAARPTTAELRSRLAALGIAAPSDTAPSAQPGRRPAGPFASTVAGQPTGAAYAETVRQGSGQSSSAGPAAPSVPGSTSPLTARATQVQPQATPGRRRAAAPTPAPSNRRALGLGLVVLGLALLLIAGLISTRL